MIDPRKLSNWFEAYAAGLSLYARQFDSASANDVVQDAFVSLLQQPREPANVKAWLYRAVRNAAISGKRSERRREDRHLKLARPEQSWFDARAEDLIDARIAQMGLEALPAQRREIIVLRIWAEMNFRDIGELVGLPVSTVFDEYHAGLKTIREKMETSCRTNLKTD